MGLKNALSNMKKDIENNDFKSSDMNKGKKNKAAILMNNTVKKQSGFNFTEEQETIIESQAHKLKVRAFAGTGKSTVLKGYAERRSKATGLNISFNRSIKEEAVRNFPKNVKCVTSHGLAYAKFGVLLKHKLTGYSDWKEVYSSAKINKPFGDNNIYNRMYIILLTEAVNLFTNTSSETITKKHFISEAFRYISKNKSLAVHLPKEEDMINDAKKLWFAMIDPNNVSVRATHDVYLKQYQLSDPILKYDYILLDEAQDSNPALLDIFNKQKCDKILVGDQYQSIYGFRNAIDAMNQVDADETLDLTCSFRFGRQVADFANSVLALRGETKQLIGMKDEDLVYYGNPLRNKGPMAYIARYNSSLLRDAIEFIKMSNGNMFFAGGFASLKPNLLIDLYNLKYREGYISDPMVATFKSYEEFKQVIEETNDIEWAGRYRLVEEYDRKLPSLIESIKRKETLNMSLAEKIYSTAHKSKGLEFDHVILAGDYYSSPMDEGVVPEKLYDQKIDPVNEELHVFYVASTRAKKTLNVPENYQEYYSDFLKMVDPKFIDFNLKKENYPIMTKNKEFFEKLVIERDKTETFYVNKKNKKIAKETDDDIFDM